MDNESIYDVMGRHIQLVDTNVSGVRAVQPPPAGFDPLTADTPTLLRLGLTPRPDPDLLPQAAAIWDRLAGQPYEHSSPPSRLGPKSRTDRTRTRWQTS